MVDFNKNYKIGDRCVVIRPLRKEDAPALALIEKECFSVPWSQSAFEELLTRDYCYYLVAEVDGEVAAFCGFTDICDEADVDHVFTAPKYRGLGLAETLLAECISIGEAAGVIAFTLEVRVSNAAAIHIYEKSGFVNEGIRPGFYEKPVEDAIIMWRR